ncbi:hypothetical protein SI65_07118 [Aspergillus cristatus]|uniref:Uncharacterized protein n=1 Tax=Aspergillus cristatus TaxID=573508 RepID=A0A1E3B8Z1_ASPCR|nr:hypothetical protein SI65_07118 [Aspergillus cristatus]
MIRGSYGSPFHAAYAQRDPYIGKRFLNHKADANLRVSIYGIPLNVATIFNRWEVFELLLNWGARASFGNIELQFSSYGEPFRIVGPQQARGADVNASGILVDILYDNGVDVDATEGFQAAVRREVFMASPSKMRRTISMRGSLKPRNFWSVEEQSSEKVYTGQCSKQPHHPQVIAL